MIKIERLNFISWRFDLCHLLCVITILPPFFTSQMSYDSGVILQEQVFNPDMLILCQALLLQIAMASGLGTLEVYISIIKAFQNSVFLSKLLKDTFLRY